MNPLSVFVFVFAVTTCSYAVSISAVTGDDRDVCPPPDQIAPCTCFRAPYTRRITALCANFSDTMDIQDIFERNPKWNLQDVHIDKAVMKYLPAQMLQKARFQTLIVSHTTLYKMFDVTPVNTPELNVYFDNVKLFRGFVWSDIANSTLREFTTSGLQMRHLGKDFVNNIPKSVLCLYFENSETVIIDPKAFAHLQNLQVLAVTKGSLKALSREWFPIPTKLMVFDFSHHKISNLPENLFVDMPDLVAFRFEGNRLTTMSEKVFIKSRVLYGLAGNPIKCNCEIKWITSPGRVVPSLVKGVCVEPNALKGKKLENLKPSDFSYCQ